MSIYSQDEEENTEENEQSFFGLVALKTIRCQTENTYDYGLHRERDLANSALGRETCLCGSKTPQCRGLLGSKSKKK